MPCTNNYVQPPRAILCQSEKISVDTDCTTPTFLWSPGGYTTQEVNLQAETEHSVNVSCSGCGSPQTLDYCIPIITAGCLFDPNPPYGPVNFIFICEALDTQTVTQPVAFQEDYVCAGDPIDWSTVEFDYTLVPTGITGAYGGSGSSVSVTIDYNYVLPGTYYLPTRVQSTNGIYSNWALLRLRIEFGNCCN